MGLSPKIDLCLTYTFRGYFVTRVIFTVFLNQRQIIDFFMQYEFHPGSNSEWGPCTYLMYTSLCAKNVLTFQLTDSIYLRTNKGANGGINLQFFLSLDGETVLASTILVWCTSTHMFTAVIALNNAKSEKIFFRFLNLSC